MTLLTSMVSSWERLVTCIITGITAFFAPVWVAITATVAFIIVDAIFGYSVSRKYNRKKIESQKIWRTLSKMAQATILITGAHTIDAHVTPSVSLHAVEFVAGAICATEFWSWLESMVELNPKGSLWRILVRILGRVIKAKGEKYLGVDIDLKQIYDDAQNDIKQSAKPRKAKRTKSKLGTTGSGDNSLPQA